MDKLFKIFNDSAPIGLCALGLKKKKPKKPLSKKKKIYPKFLGIKKAVLT